MKRSTSRRDFLKSTTAAGVGFWAAAGAMPRESRSAIERIRFGCIGVGGKGSSDSKDASRNGDVVAICDIDDNTLGKAGETFAGAKKYSDFRKLLEEMGPNIDAVTVSTPDHTHAAASLMAMRMGKACFTQKPMTHSIYKAQDGRCRSRDEGRDPDGQSRHRQPRTAASRRGREGWHAR